MNNCDKIKEKILSSKEYVFEERKRKMIIDLEEFFLCLPNGYYKLKVGGLIGGTTINITINHAYKSKVDIDEPTYSGGRSFSRMNYKHVKWMHDNKEEMIKRIKFVPL